MMNIGKNICDTYQMWMMRISKGARYTKTNV
jgi:hypothetical protein